MIITETRTISPEELNKIQNGIEQCLLLHLTLNETKNTLQVKAGVIPEFTEFAWKKLEEANPEFFKAYHFRLLLKDQVEKFNRLLDRQAELMVQLANTPAIHMPQNMQEESMAQLTNTPAIHMPQGNMLMTGSSNMGLVQTMNGEMENPGNMGFVQAMNGQWMNMRNTGLMQAMNGGMRNLGTGHINGSHFMFGPNGDVLDAHHAAVEIPVSSYSSMESQSHSINNTLLGVNAAFENMGQIPGSFSHPDLTPISGILESYSGSPFLASGSNSLNPQERVEQQDNRRLDTNGRFER